MLPQSENSSQAKQKTLEYIVYIPILTQKVDHKEMLACKLCVSADAMEKNGNKITFQMVNLKNKKNSLISLFSAPHQHVYC
jgi:hypothetical protein